MDHIMTNVGMAAIPSSPDGKYHYLLVIQFGDDRRTGTGERGWIDDKPIATFEDLAIVRNRFHESWMTSIIVTNVVLLSAPTPKGP